jgi:predicted short-subunit dehydrogenase-like oxidoreductase (DUF2520 family)
MAFLNTIGKGIFCFQETGAMTTIGFIGAGIMGNAMALRLTQLGYPIVAISSRNYNSAISLSQQIPNCHAYRNAQDVADHTDMVFITTPDDIIPVIAVQVAWHRGQYVLHSSGVAPTDILRPACAAGAMVGVFHPLQSFTSSEQAILNLPGSTFALEADPPLLGILKKMAEDLGGSCIELEAQDKVAYHAAAVMVSNYMITLTQMALDLWQTFGVSAPKATQALLPLMQGTLRNIGAVGLPQCLTGPIARGDIGTIRKHLAALEKVAPQLLGAYRELGRQTLPIALAKGKLTPEQADELAELLGPSIEGQGDIYEEHAEKQNTSRPRH